ncbi:uncharacterized protein LOC143265172 [Megachile rotundata]|uniref:uncharacterized protein LOC143265172 n=1 Tax=Megachile rotundata TaxID=143995 RepID=UPI003FD32633
MHKEKSVKKADGSLGHQVYRKPTHTNRYLHATSHHHPSQKNSVITSLIHRATCISEQENLAQINRTIDQLTNQATKPTHKRTTDAHDKKHATTFLQYIQGTTDRIGRILRKHNIKTVFTTHTKIGQLLTYPKDPQPQPSTPGVYKILCSCGQVYIGETGRSVNTRVKEHERWATFKQPWRNTRLPLGTKSCLIKQKFWRKHQPIFLESTGKQ